MQPPATNIAVAKNECPTTHPVNPVDDHVAPSATGSE